MMNLSEVNWDPNAVGTWPLAVKATAIFIVCASVAGGCIYFDTMAQIETLAAVQQKESELKKTFEEKQAKAANLPDYQYQLTQIEALLDEMINEMPSEAEVASLLVDISQTGLASGLEFKLFKPKAAEFKEFYFELPIEIAVTGKYEELGLFVSGLAQLPRIVTVHDVDITPENKDGLLLMKATVKTYNEAASKNPADKGKKSNKDKRGGK